MTIQLEFVRVVIKKNILKNLENYKKRKEQVGQLKMEVKELHIVKFVSALMLLIAIEKTGYIKDIILYEILPKRKNIVFEISKEYLAKLFEEAPDKCPIFGTEFGIVKYSPGNKDNNGSFRNNSFSIDRIVPELGYVEGNLIIISDLANRIKNNATPDQIIQVGKFYKKLQEK